MTLTSEDWTEGQEEEEGTADETPRVENEDSDCEDLGWTEFKRPFPFIHTCLNVGLYYAFNGALSPFMLRSCGWNETIVDSDTPAGNTVLDLTDLSAVRYSFVYPEYPWTRYERERRKRMGLEDDDNLPRNEPLSATQYLEIACADWDNQDEDAGTELAEHLNNVGIIDIATLKSAWPVTWGRTEDKSQESQPNQDITPSSFAQMGSLRETSLKKVITEVFSCSLAALSKVLESVEDLPNFWSALKQEIFTTPELVSDSATAGQLLRTILEDVHIVDLSPFNLSEEQISQILCHETKRIPVEILSLSGNHNIQTELLRKILPYFKSLKQLHLLNTPQIPLKAKLEIMRSREGTMLIDTELLAAPFLFSEKNHRRVHQARSCPLHYVRPVVKQIAFLVCGRDAKNTEVELLPGGEVDISKLVPYSQIQYSTRVRYTRTLPLESLNRNKSDSLASLCSFMSRMLTKFPLVDDMYSGFSYARYLALEFSTYSPEKNQNYQATTISQELWNIQSRFESQRIGETSVQTMPDDIRAGEWTFMIVCKFKPYALRYAFVTAKSLDHSSRSQGTFTKVEPSEREFPGIIVLCFEDYLQEIFPGRSTEAKKARQKMLKEWNECTFEGKRITQSSRAEVESWLRSGDFTDEQRQRFRGAADRESHDKVEGSKAAGESFGPSSRYPKRKRT